MPYVLQVFDSHGAASTEVLSGRPLRLTHSDWQIAFELRDEGLWLKLAEGTPVALNDVSISKSARVAHGDEVAFGDMRVIIANNPPDAGPRPLLLNDEAWEALARAELQLKSPAQRISLAFITSAALSPSARSALFERTMREVESLEVSAVWGEGAKDLLWGLFLENAPGSLDRIASELPTIGGERAKAVLVRAESPSDSLDRLLGALWKGLLGKSSRDDFVVEDPVMVRLHANIERLAHASDFVCAVGEPGSGRSTFLRRIAASAQQELLERYGSAKVGHEGWQLVRDLRHPLPRDAPGRILCTAQAPVAGIPMHIAIPPLRARPREIMRLADAALARFRLHAARPRLKFSDEVPPMLLAWRWPGNVDELQNVVYRAAQATVRDEVGSDQLPEAIRGKAQTPNRKSALLSAERDLFVDVLARTRWNVTAAAARLGMPRRTLVNRLARLKLKRPSR